MLTTKDVLNLLRRANSGVSISEDRIRHVLRRGGIVVPNTFGGRLCWSEANVAALAACLGLQAPLPVTASGRGEPA